MKTLAHVWNWYKTTKENLVRMRRLGEKWNDASVQNSSIREDDRFKMLVAEDIVEEAKLSLEPIDDLAVLVLFSVFESLVRDYLVELAKPEKERIVNPILKEAAEDAISGVKEGSFSHYVLDPLKNQSRVSVDLVEQIKQVRGYRNWVAHGSRDVPKNNVTPQQAYDRLQKFLVALRITDSIEKDSIE